MQGDAFSPHLSFNGFVMLFLFFLTTFFLKVTSSLWGWFRGEVERERPPVLNMYCTPGDFVFNLYEAL